MFNIKLMVLLLGCAGAVMASIPFMDCGSEYVLEDVDIEGCTSLPCVLVAGTQHKIHMKLYARSVSKHLKQNVNLILRGIHIPIKVTPEDLCDQIVCPVTSQHNASFTAIMDLRNEDLTAQLDGDLHWIMKNDKQSQVMCMVTRVYVKVRYSEYENGSDRADNGV